MNSCLDVLAHILLRSFFSFTLMVMIVDKRKKKSYVASALSKYKMAVYTKNGTSARHLDPFNLLILLRFRYPFDQQHTKFHTLLENVAF
jgi:phenylalanine-4-hydroxylase